MGTTGINVLCPAELVYVQPNLKLCPAILLTEVGMYEITYMKSFRRLKLIG